MRNKFVIGSNMFLICVVRLWIETVYFLLEKQGLIGLLKIIQMYFL